MAKKMMKESVEEVLFKLTNAVIKGQDAALPTLAEVEEQYIEVTLFICDGNKPKAARKLGISSATMDRKLRKMRPASSPR